MSRFGQYTREPGNMNDSQFIPSPVTCMIHNSSKIMNNWDFVLGDKLPVIDDTATAIYLISKKAESSKS